MDHWLENFPFKKPVSALLEGSERTKEIAAQVFGVPVSSLRLEDVQRLAAKVLKVPEGVITKPVDWDLVDTARLLLGCAVHCEERDSYISSILTFNPALQVKLKDEIEDLFNGFKSCTHIKAPQTPSITILETSMESHVTNHEEELETCRKTIHDLRQEQIFLEKTVLGYEKELEDSKSTIRGHQKQIQVLKEELSQLRTAAIEESKEGEQQDAIIEEDLQEMSKLRGFILKKDQMIRIHEEEKISMREKFVEIEKQRGLLQNKLKEFQGLLGESRSKLQELHGEKKRIEQELVAEQRDHSNEVESLRSQLRSEQESREEGKKALKDELDEWIDYVQELEAKEKGMTEEVKLLKSQVQKVSNAFESLHRDYSALKEESSKEIEFWNHKIVDIHHDLEDFKKKHARVCADLESSKHNLEQSSYATSHQEKQMEMKISELQQLHKEERKSKLNLEASIPSMIEDAVRERVALMEEQPSEMKKLMSMICVNGSPNARIERNLDEMVKKLISTPVSKFGGDRVDSKTVGRLKESVQDLQDENSKLQRENEWLREQFSARNRASKSPKIDFTSGTNQTLASANKLAMREMLQKLEIENQALKKSTMCEIQRRSDLEAVVKELQAELSKLHIRETFASSKLLRHGNVPVEALNASWFQAEFLSFEKESKHSSLQRLRDSVNVAESESDAGNVGEQEEEEESSHTISRLVEDEDSNLSAPKRSFPTEFSTPPLQTKRVNHPEVEVPEVTLGNSENSDDLFCHENLSSQSQDKKRTARPFNATHSVVRKIFTSFDNDNNNSID